MPIRIFSKDADRHPYVSEPVEKLSEVVDIVDGLRIMGHTEIMVGASGGEALPYAQWKIAAEGISVDSVDDRLR